MSDPGLSSIVVFMSDGNRAALSRLLAERTVLARGVLQFARNTDELQRAATRGSWVLIEGSRLSELAVSAGVREAPQTNAHFGPALGATVNAYLERLPAATQAAFAAALQSPRAWSVKRIAHNARVSTRQLVRQCVAANCAVPPKDLLLAARLASAQALLCGSRAYSVRALAHACGWVDARSLRAALRRVGLPSLAALREFRDGDASVSDLIERMVQRKA